MSSKRYNQLVSAAYRNNDVSAMRDAFNDYQDKHCLYPTRQLIYDAHTGTQRYIEVACGRCYHCQKTKINEWCTRMYAHAEDFKNVYFVTLTYRSITNPDLPLNNLFLTKLSQAVWNRDPFNSTRHLSYNPCVLCKSHYQNFLKRLRKNTGISDLTYVLSGEYGKQYGRPHFHIVFFTNQQLTIRDIQKAWSIAVWRNPDGTFQTRTSQTKNGTAYDMPIGHVDFHDLVTNGTFNTTCKIKVDGSFMNARNCFGYVCKYVVKREDANLNRVDLAYKNLFHKYTIPNTIGKTLHDILFYDRCDQFTQEQLYQLTQIKKLNPYEKIMFQPCKTIFQHGLCRSRQVKKFGFPYREYLLPEFFADFRNLFRPFCEFSRATPIGSVYTRKHIQEFTEGVFNRPLLQTDGFVVPRYFRTKAQEYSYGLRKCKRTIKSTSLNFSNLPDLFGRLSESYQTGVPLREYIHHPWRAQVISVALQNPYQYFVDKYTGEKIIFFNEHAQYYKYSRKEKAYKFTRALPLADWLRDSIDRLRAELMRHDQQMRISQENMRLAESAHLMLLDYGDDLEHLRSCYKERAEAVRNEQQKMYNHTHLFVE